MQQKQITKHCCVHNGNYNVYLQLVNDKIFDLILLSKLDDSLFHTRFDQQSLPEQCVNLFGDISSLFQFIETDGFNKDKMSISDIGNITLTQFIEKKGKQIKVQCTFHANKIDQIQLQNRFLLKIIRCHQDKPLSEQKKQLQFKTKEMDSKIVSSKIEVSPVKEQNKNSIIRNFQYKKMHMTIDMHNNPFIKSFSKLHNTIKIEDYVKSRIKLFFFEVIPRNQCVFFTIRIVKTKANNFGFGIIDRQQPRDKKSFSSICYDFNTGDLKDTWFIRQVAIAKWRSSVGRPIPALTNALLRMQVNMKAQKVSFYCNNQWVCETVITNHLMSKQIIPYISVKHMADQFLLNDQ